MKTLIVSICILFAGVIAHAQINYNAAKRQAHQAVDKTEAVSQGQSAPTQPAPPSSPSAPSAAASAMPDDPMLKATLQNIGDLRHDFDALSAGFGPKSLTNDLAVAALGNKASAATIDKLAGDLEAALSGNDKLGAQHPKLAQHIHAAFNSARLSPTQKDSIEKDVQKMFQAAGVATEKTTAVLDDLKAVENETK